MLRKQRVIRKTAKTRRERSEINYLTDDERKALFATIKDPRDRAIFVLGFWRGLRASEVGMLMLEHWRPASGKLYVRRLKGSVSREYTLTYAEVQALKRWLKIRGEDRGPIFRGYKRKGIERHAVNNLMRKYATLAHLPREKRHWHCLKHSVATFLVDKDEAIAMVQDHLGHADIRSTMVYVRIAQRKRDEMAARLSAFDAL